MPQVAGQPAPGTSPLYSVTPSQPGYGSPASAPPAAPSAPPPFAAPPYGAAPQPYAGAAQPPSGAPPSIGFDHLAMPTPGKHNIQIKSELSMQVFG